MCLRLFGKSKLNAKNEGGVGKDSNTQSSHTLIGPSPSDSLTLLSSPSLGRAAPTCQLRKALWNHLCLFSFSIPPLHHLKISLILSSKISRSRSQPATSTVTTVVQPQIQAAWNTAMVRSTVSLFLYCLPCCICFTVSLSPSFL